MAYLDKRLFDEERILYRGDFHWLRKLAAWLALIFLGVVVIGIVIFVREMVKMNTSEFVVTNRRLLFKTGLFSAHVRELSLNAIEGAEIRQGILGRIFGFGDLVIEGRGEGEINFPTMASPATFLAAAEKARHELAQASVEKLADAVDEAA